MTPGMAKPWSAARGLLCRITTCIRHNRLLIDADHDGADMPMNEMPAAGSMTGMRDDEGKTRDPSDTHA